MHTVQIAACAQAYGLRLCMHTLTDVQVHSPQWQGPACGKWHVLGVATMTIPLGQCAICTMLQSAISRSILLLNWCIPVYIHLYIIYVYTHICTYTYIHVYTHRYTHARLNICMYVYIHVCTYVRVCVHTCSGMMGETSTCMPCCPLGRCGLIEPMCLFDIRFPSGPASMVTYFQTMAGLQKTPRLSKTP